MDGSSPVVFFSMISSGCFFSTGCLSRLEGVLFVFSVFLLFLNAIHEDRFLGCV